MPSFSLKLKYSQTNTSTLGQEMTLLEAYAKKISSCKGVLHCNVYFRSNFSTKTSILGPKMALLEAYTKQIFQAKMFCTAMFTSGPIFHQELQF